MGVCECSSQETTESTLSHSFIKVSWMRKLLYTAWAVLSTFWLSHPPSLSLSLLYLLLPPLLIPRILLRNIQRLCISVHLSSAAHISVYLILLVNRLWIFIFGVEMQWQLIKEPRSRSLLESEYALNVLWIKVNNASHDSPMNNTEEMQKYEYRFDL